MHSPTPRHEPEAPSRVEPLPVTPRRVLLPRAGLRCLVAGDPAVLRRKVAEFAGRPA